MARTYHLRCWTRFHAPMDEVWRWKTDAANLDAERAPALALRGVDRAALTAALRGEAPPGTLSARVALLGWLPGPSWPVEVVAQEPGRSVSVRSPDNPLFFIWEHERRIEQADGACRFMDAITFAPRIAPTRLVARAVEELFIHAHRQAARHFPTDARATAVAMLRLADDGEPKPDDPE